MTPALPCHLVEFIELGKIFVIPVSLENGVLELQVATYIDDYLVEAEPFLQLLKDSRARDAKAKAAEKGGKPQPPWDT